MIKLAEHRTGVPIRAIRVSRKKMAEHFGCSVSRLVKMPKQMLGCLSLGYAVKTRGYKLVKMTVSDIVGVTIHKNRKKIAKSIERTNALLSRLRDV